MYCYAPAPHSVGEPCVAREGSVTQTAKRAFDSSVSATPAARALESWEAISCLLPPPHRKRPHQRRERHVRRLPAGRDGVDDVRREQGD